MVWFGIINAIGMILSISVIEIVRRWVDTSTNRIVVRLLMVVTTVLVVSLIVFARADTFALPLYSRAIRRPEIEPKKVVTLE